MSFTFPIPWPRQPKRKIEKCKKCKGTKEREGTPCPECKGAGVIAMKREVISQRLIYATVLPDDSGERMLDVEFQQGKGKIQLPAELCRDEKGKLIPDEKSNPELIKALREWAQCVLHPEMPNEKPKD